MREVCRAMRGFCAHGNLRVPKAYVAMCVSGGRVSLGRVVWLVG